MSGERPQVMVANDDDLVRESPRDLVRERGFSARSFSSAEVFLRFAIATALRQP